MDLSGLTRTQLECLLIQKQLEITNGQGPQASTLQGAQAIAIPPTSHPVIIARPTTLAHTEKGKEKAHPAQGLQIKASSLPNNPVDSKTGPSTSGQRRIQVDKPSTDNDDNETINDEDDDHDMDENPRTAPDNLPNLDDLKDHKKSKANYLEWFALLIPSKDKRCAIRAKMREACHRKWDSGQTWKYVPETDRVWAVLHISKRYPEFTPKYHVILKNLIMNHLTQKKNHDKEQASKVEAAAPKAIPAPSKSNVSKTDPVEKKKASSASQKVSGASQKASGASQKKAGSKNESTQKNKKRKRDADDGSLPANLPAPKKASVSKASKKAAEMIIDPDLLEEDAQRALEQQPQPPRTTNGHRIVRSGIPITEPPYGPPSPTPPPVVNPFSFANVTSGVAPVPTLPEGAVMPLPASCFGFPFPPAPGASLPSIEDRPNKPKGRPRRKATKAEIEQELAEAEVAQEQGPAIATLGSASTAPTIAPCDAPTSSIASDTVSSDELQTVTKARKKGPSVPGVKRPAKQQKRGRELDPEPTETVKHSKPKAKPKTKTKVVQPAVAGPGPSTARNTRSRLMKQEQIAASLVGHSLVDDQVSDVNLDA